MNKAKALFAAGIIVVVAAASGALWYLNENGRIGTETTTAAQTTIADYNYENKTEKNTTAETTTVKAEPASAYTKDEINNFLSVFSNVYFAEQSGFNSKNYSDYDLLLFAFLHIKNTDKSAVVTEIRDDDIIYYSGVSIEKVNTVLDEYFGLVVDAQSVYTEQDHLFFLYENGMFYTPAGDGLSYNNRCEATSVAYSGDNIIVQFTIYAGNEKYATGEARIKASESGLKLDLYKVYF